MKKFLMLLFLVGCGFQPMFSGQDTDVYVPPIRGINGIELRNALNAKFGGARQPDAAYTLSVDLSDPMTTYKALQNTGDASWREVRVTATYHLTHDGKTIASGTESASESYAFVRYLVAANASHNNAVANVINVLSDRISARVIAETHGYEQKNAAKK